MRIVHIEDFFKPQMGYQINIIPKYQVRQGHEVYIVSGKIKKSQLNKYDKYAKNINVPSDDLEFEKDTGVKIVRVEINKIISNRAVFNNDIFKIVEDIHPDIVYVHGNDTLIGIQYTLKSSKLNYPIITDSHMLEMASRNKFKLIFRTIYRRIVTPIIRKRKIKVIRTQDDDFVERNYNIPLELAPFISYGSELDLFYPSIQMKNEFRKEHDIENDELIFMYAGKITETKGGLLLVKAFEKKFTINKRQAVLLLIGDFDNEYALQAKKILDKSENKVLWFNKQKYKDLHYFYKVADIAIFPKQCSLSFYDVQASGLPVISEANNINVKRNSYNNGIVYEINNVKDLRTKIMYFLELDDESIKEMSVNARSLIEQEYSYEVVTRRYTDVMSGVIEEWKEKK